MKARVLRRRDEEIEPNDEAVAHGAGGQSRKVNLTHAAEEVGVKVLKARDNG